MKEGGISRRTINIILLVIVFILVVALVYYFYFSPKKCSTDICFTTALASCDKASYSKDDGSEIVLYKINGAKSWQCAVNVKVQQVKSGPAELGKLEGKDMTCLIPLGSITDPARDLKNCQGLLKEEIQDIMIQRLHAQIVSNLDKISEVNTTVI